MNRIEKLEALLKENPHDSFMNHALALEHVKLGDDEKAGQIFRNILSTDASYIGSYYHLGKLLERQGDEKGAIAVYKNGMDAAKMQGDMHAFNELRSACEFLEF